MKPIISIIMGSSSDWKTMKKAADVLDKFGVAYEKKVVSAHRTPDLMFRHRRACPIPCPQWCGFALFYRADAGWRARCDYGDR